MLDAINTAAGPMLGHEYANRYLTSEERRRAGAIADEVRDALLAAVRGAGFTVDHSEAGLYLWATRGESGRATVAWLAERGILVAPGEFYGPAGEQFVRIALTATDERIAAAVCRLT